MTKNLSSLIAVDPSSTCTGWAMWNLPDKCCEAHGKLKPKTKMSSIERMQQISTELKEICESFNVDCGVIELPSGKVHQRIKETSKGQGLSVYGMAAGYIFKTLVELLGDENVHFYLDNEWTSNGKCKTYGSKVRRQQIARLVDRSYNSADDSGMDISDAIALGHYHIGKLKLKQIRASAV